MSNLSIFVRTIRSRSIEHKTAMNLLAEAGLAGQMIAILRQELDSMVRVIYLITQSPERREVLIDALIRGEKWTREGTRAKITDREMVDLAQGLQGWTKSVYKFGCAFIHLSHLHDYNDSDPMDHLPRDERCDIIDHCRFYHGGPAVGDERFADLVPYLPNVLDKISGNLECYLETLESGNIQEPHEVW